MRLKILIILLQIGLVLCAEKPKKGKKTIRDDYNFGYEIATDDAHKFHKEVGDGTGRKVGSYGFTDPDGRQRVVQYVADENGFRVQIKTNEPGTNTHEAAASLVSKKAPILLLEGKDSPMSIPVKEEDKDTLAGAHSFQSPVLPTGPVRKYDARKMHINVVEDRPVPPFAQSIEYKPHPKSINIGPIDFFGGVPMATPLLPTGPVRMFRDVKPVPFSEPQALQPIAQNYIEQPKFEPQRLAHSPTLRAHSEPQVIVRNKDLETSKPIPKFDPEKFNILSMYETTLLPNGPKMYDGPVHAYVKPPKKLRMRRKKVVKKKHKFSSPFLPIGPVRMERDGLSTTENGNGLELSQTIDSSSTVFYVPAEHVPPVPRKLAKPIFKRKRQPLQHGDGTLSGDRIPQRTGHKRVIYDEPEHDNKPVPLYKDSAVHGFLPSNGAKSLPAEPYRLVKPPVTNEPVGNSLSGSQPLLAAPQHIPPQHFQPPPHEQQLQQLSLPPQNPRQRPPQGQSAAQHPLLPPPYQPHPQHLPPQSHQPPPQHFQPPPHPQTIQAQQFVRPQPPQAPPQHNIPHQAPVQHFPPQQSHTLPPAQPHHPQHQPIIPHHHQQLPQRPPPQHHSPPQQAPPPPQQQFTVPPHHRPQHPPQTLSSSQPPAHHLPPHQPPPQHIPHQPPPQHLPPQYAPQQLPPQGPPPQPITVPQHLIPSYPKLRDLERDTVVPHQVAKLPPRPVSAPAPAPQPPRFSPPVAREFPGQNAIRQVPAPQLHLQQAGIPPAQERPQPNNAQYYSQQAPTYLQNQEAIFSKYFNPETRPPPDSFNPQARRPLFTPKIDPNFPTGGSPPRPTSPVQNLPPPPEIAYHRTPGRINIQAPLEQTPEHRFPSNGIQHIRSQPQIEYQPQNGRLPPHVRPLPQGDNSHPVQEYAPPPPHGGSRPPLGHIQTPAPPPQSFLPPQHRQHIPQHPQAPSPQLHQPPPQYIQQPPPQHLPPHHYTPPPPQQHNAPQPYHLPSSLPQTATSPIPHHQAGQLQIQASAYYAQTQPADRPQTNRAPTVPDAPLSFADHSPFDYIKKSKS